MHKQRVSQALTTNIVYWHLKKDSDRRLKSSSIEGEVVVDAIHLRDILRFERLK